MATVRHPLSNLNIGLDRIPDIPDKKENLLKIISVDHLITENGQSHETSKYEIMNRKGSDARLVVRRGQAFHLRLQLNREYKSQSDEIQIRFELDGVRDRSNTQNGTCMMKSVVDSDEAMKNIWQASLDSKDTKSVTIKIKSPADVAIGKWKLEICAEGENSSDTVTSPIEIPFYIILNPWCSDDTVYMASKKERQEYIMADEGCIWAGSEDNMGVKSWSYSQFSTDILDCAIYLVNEVAEIDPKDRNDPILISRGLSAVINSNDENGVLMGNWSREISGGIKPSEWMGSQEILEKYYATKTPVRYGQCWVFAGVLGTICRAIGLPCRVVTNFESAHDTQGNLDIDIVVDATTKERMGHISNDIVWNFHVWNEVWMKRLDLGSKYGGWQVIDATPQERSENIYQCGPVSVVAIKSGEVHLPYDGTFVYAEINADYYYWVYRGHGKQELISKDRYKIGRSISTKAVGSSEREDITHTYKFPEDTIEEREAMLVAHQHCKSSFDKLLITNECKDVEFKLQATDSVFGKPFQADLLITNKSTRSLEMTAILRAEAILYTGKHGELLKTLKIDVSLKPGVSGAHSLIIPWKEYGHKVIDDGNLKVCCFVTGNNSNIEYLTSKNFHLQKPIIELESISKVINGETLKVTASLINPLPIPLKNGKFRVMGLGLGQCLEIKLNENVQPGDKARCTFSMIPKLKDNGAISVKFDSEEIGDVRGLFPVKVETQ